MHAIVFETEQFKNDVVHYGLQRQYEAFKKKVEQGEVNFETIGRLKKTQKLEYNLRLIAWDGTLDLLNSIQEPGLIVFLKVYAKKEKEYKQLTNRTDQRGRSEVIDRLMKLLTSEYKEELKKEYKRRTSLPVPVKEPLPEELLKWLELDPWQDKTGLLNIGFCESQLWSHEIKELRDYNSQFHDILLSIVNDIGSPQQNINTVVFQNLYIKIAETEKCAAYFSIHQTKQGTIVFLVKPVLLDENFQTEQIAKELGEKFKGIFKKENLDIDDVFKYSRQAYPVDTVLDSKLWFQIENDDEAHPALSTEEENILLSISGPEGKTLPIFINGRAGSGKSTLLQFIFCLFAKKYLSGVKGSILYLTYSEQLRKSASNLCRDILKSHYNFVSNKTETQFSEQSIESIINNSFCTFHNFLLQILPEKERKKFAESKKVTFYHFKNYFFPSLRTHPKCSPETAWHVIRAYIKGRESSVELKPEEYKNIEAKDKTVSLDTYNIVFEKVWPQYKNYLEDQHRWDDLDLVCRVLRLMDLDREFVGPAGYTAIFCDEAQDFTKNELSLILRMSVFSKYNLKEHKHRIKGLPFAFAGDPLQTLTPTGFKWDRFRSTFYEVLKEQLDIEDPKPFLDKDKMLELQYNYRSNEGIVKLSNVIQFLRLSLLGESCLPQKCWQEDVAFGNSIQQTAPKYFIFKQNLSDADFIKHAKLSVIILPSEEGGLDEFINNDPVLNRMNELHEGEIAFEDAVSSKGLEMDKVILYKFGHFLKNAENLWSGKTIEEEQLLLYYRYFFNRLYVAMTRARKQLNIVDTKEGYNKFWNRFTSEAKLRDIPYFDNWNDQDCFEYLLKGNEASDLHEDNPLNVARMYKEAGIKERNPKQMAKAANIFSIHGELDATECRAYEKWFSGMHAEAGRMFLQIRSNSERAIECFWEGEIWDEINKWYADNSIMTSEDQAKRQLAKFWLAMEKGEKKGILEHGIRVLQYNYYELQDRLLIERFETAGQSIIAWLKENIDVLEQKECKHVADLLEDIEDHTVVDLELSLYYKAGEYIRVVDISEENDWEDERYYNSKLKIAESVEEKINCLLSLGEKDKAVKLYETKKEEIKNKYLLRELQKIYKINEDFDNSLLVYLSLNEHNEAWNELIQHYGIISDGIKRKFLKVILAGVIQGGSVKNLFVDIIAGKVSKDKLPFLYNCLFEVIASKNTDNEDLSLLTHRLVNDLFDKSNKLVVEKFDSTKVIAAILAYERIDCLRKDLLPFYEKVLEKGNLDPAVRTFIRERWLYVKSRHVDGTVRYRKEARLELEKKQDEWRISKIPNGVPCLEDIMKRFGEIEKTYPVTAIPVKEEINLRADGDRNFGFEGIIEGDFNEKKKETKIQLNLKTKPSYIYIEIGEKRFKLLLKG